MDDNHDKDMARNQVIAIVLMALVVLVWFKWFAPPPPERRAPTQAPGQTGQLVPSTGALAVEPPRPEFVPATPSPEASELWDGLPEVPAIADDAAEEVTLADEHMELVLTRIGARLKHATLLLGDNGDKSIQLVPESTLTDVEVMYPMGLHFTDEGLGDALDVRRFDVEADPSGKSVTFSLIIEGRAAVRKTFSLTGKPSVVNVRVDYENLTSEPCLMGMDRTPAYMLTWGPNIASGHKTRFTKEEIVVRKDGQIDMLGVAKMKPPKEGEPYTKSVEDAEWIAVQSGYFVVALKPAFETAHTWATGNPQKYRFGLAVPRFEAAPGGVQTNEFSLYLGPNQHRYLAQGWDSLPAVLRFFSPTWEIMDWFAKFLLRILNWFHDNVIANYGFAIIFLTVVVRMAMYPLTLKSMRSMKRMQMLAPEMEEMKKKYGEEPQELNKKMMELYKERGVNPLGGCLPIALQMPIFITLYRMLWTAYEMWGAPFIFWITDLSQADHMFHMPWMKAVPFLGETFEYFNLLPLLMGLAMYLNQKLMPTSGPVQNPQQKMIMNIMPIFFCFICYNMAAGLNLYILTSTILGMVQQKFTRVSETEAKPKKKAVGKRQHFYTAAEARKRQQARESKRDKRRKPPRPRGTKPKK